MSWFQDPTSGAAVLVVVLSLVAAPLIVLLVIRVFGTRADDGVAGMSAVPTPSPWPPDTGDDLEPYHLYFEQLNSMLEPIEPFSLDQFKASCAVPSTTVTVRFNSEGGFTTEPMLQEGDRR